MFCERTVRVCVLALIFALVLCTTRTRACAQLLLASRGRAAFTQEEEDDLPNGFFDYFNEVYCDPVSQYMDFYFFFDFYADSECAVTDVALLHMPMTVGATRGACGA